MTKDELISILELRFNEQTHALGYKILLERMEEIEDYLRPFECSIRVGRLGKSVFISGNQGKTIGFYPANFFTSPNYLTEIRLEELKERLP